jgi:hypothetical protein
MSNCLIVIIMTMQIFTGDGQAASVSVTACVDFEAATVTPRQQLPASPMVKGVDYGILADIGDFQRDNSHISGPGPDLGRGQVVLIWTQ